MSAGNIDLPKTVNIYEDVWTCSDKMRYEIADFFKDKTYFKIAEIGAHKGYTTKILSHLFSKVYAVDNNVEWTNYNKNYNIDRNNIEYVHLNIYNDSWNILPQDIEVSFIDACHTYDTCKSDIINSMARFSKLKYIIFDDYGVWEGVKKVIDEMIQHNILKIEKFIGLNDVPGISCVVHNTYEGVICSVNKKILVTDLKNRKYSWQNHSITFLDECQMDAFGRGIYYQQSVDTFQAKFGGKNHTLVFNSDYTEFRSTREGDNEIVNGKLLN
jgi:hypothetical protein